MQGPSKYDPPPEVDLHGLRVELGLRRLRQAVHAARLRGPGRLIVITGRGMGNRQQEPILRRAVEAWPGGPEGRSHGVRGFRLRNRGGALEVDLGPGTGTAGGA